MGIESILTLYSYDSKDWLAWDRLSSLVKMRLLRGGTGKEKQVEEGRGRGPTEDLNVVSLLLRGPLHSIN